MNVKCYDAQTNSFYNGILKRRKNGRHYVERAEDGSPEPEYYLSPGWIDLHTHIFDGFGLFGTNADEIGWKHGTCLVVDAGTVGDFTLTAFRRYVMPAIHTNFKLFLCISPIGVIFHHEYNAMEYLDVDRTVDTIEHNRDIISGVKVRIGSEVIRHEGVEPLRMAAEAARRVHLPLMVHIGGVPPLFSDVEPYLQKGDVLTHVFNGRGGGVWNDDGTPTPAMRKVLDKGVILDVGHGNGSFDYGIYQRAVSHPLPKYTLGTDLHSHSIHKCVFDMDTFLSKMYGLGMTLEDVMYGVTAGPAHVLGLTDWCDLFNLENATIFKIVDREKEYTDSAEHTLTFQKAIQPAAVILKDEWLELEL